MFNFMKILRSKAQDFFVKNIIRDFWTIKPWLSSYNILVIFQQTDDQEAYEGRVTILDVHGGGSHADEMKKFLKDAQQVRDKVVGIESIVNQIRGYHGKITGSAARNEGNLPALWPGA